MKIVIVYAFILASGQVIEAEQPGADPYGYKPLKSMQHCETVIAGQAKRFREHFAVAENGMFVDVKIRCEKRASEPKRRRP